MSTTQYSMKKNFENDQNDSQVINGYMVATNLKPQMTIYEDFFFLILERAFLRLLAN